MSPNLGNYLAQLGGYGQQNPNATPTKPMNEWGMEDYMQALNAQKGTPQTGIAGQSNLGRALAGGLTSVAGGGGFMQGVGKAFGGTAGGGGLIASL